MKLYTIAVALTMAMGTAQAAPIRIEVHKGSQTMIVAQTGHPTAFWAVSTARVGKITPTGVYSPQRLERNWHSRRYNMAPMPYSIFYSGPYAIHGTTQTDRLGRRASAGCVRLHPENARALFDRVRTARASGHPVTIIIKE